MSLFDRMKDQVIGSRLEEEAYYEAALQEIESGGRRAGIWAKALAKSNGDQDAAKGLYVRLLVKKLKDEMHIAKRMKQERLRELEEEEEKEKERERKGREHLRKAQEIANAESNISPIFWVVAILATILIAYIAREAELNSSHGDNKDNVSSYTQAKDAHQGLSEYDQVIVRLESRHPQLNPDHHMYDQKLVNRVVELRDSYHERGYNSIDAVQMAVEDAFPTGVESDQPTYWDPPEQPSHWNSPEQPSHWNSPNNSNTSENSKCSFKSVMSNQDYRDCGIEPPES